MRVLVTGVKGQLGFDCVKELNRRGYTDILSTDKDELDITDKQAIDSYFDLYKPEAVIHCAAYTAVDKAEHEEALARSINVEGTRNLAEAAERVGAKMIYISTDYVFPGDGDSFYEVSDKKGPTSVYGKTKYEGELAALICSKLFIVRISWVFGVNGNNFVKTMLKLSETRNELTVVNDQIGSPTYTFDLAKLLCDMIETEKYGVYHATNEGVCSWAEFARELFKQSKRNVIVKDITTKEYLANKQDQAIRPLNSRMSKKSLDEAGFARLPSWQDALKRYLKELNV